MNSKHLAWMAAAGVGGYMLWQALRPRYDFRNKVVVVTGGSRGLGLVLTRELVRRRARVVICARDGQELADARAEVPGVISKTCDITDAEQAREFVSKVQEHVGPIDVLINNAGILTVGPISLMTRQDYEASLAVHFWGVYNMVEAVVPAMREREAGRIVNISSIGGKIGIPHLVPYSVGKFALVGYSEGLRAELANNGIVVTTVCPGLMRTGSPRNVTFKGQQEAEYLWFKWSDSIPFLTMSAEGAARAILDACARGDAECVLTVPARFGVLMKTLLPETTAMLIDLANRLMPRPGDRSLETRKGYELESAWTRNFVTTLTDRAAVLNNEM